MPPQRINADKPHLWKADIAASVDQFNQWFDGLWHGRSLAYTVAVLAVTISLVCFWVAWIASGPLPSQPDERRER